MEYITPAQMKEIDRRTQEEFGIPDTILMENAGRAVFQKAIEMLSKQSDKRAIVVCGSGNNGGDAFVVARHLMNHGIDVDTLLLVPVEKLRGEAKANYDRARKIAQTIGKDIEVMNEANLDSFKEKLESTKGGLIVDGIFGTGLGRDVTEPQRTIIQLINDSRKPVLAVDVPSGLDATEGKVLGICVQANATVTFAKPKTGFPGNENYTGEVIVADISTPKVLLEE
ncbi:MAG: NAD(P)H-hydrate epimerase [Dehalococcoidia bacterium]